MKGEYLDLQHPHAKHHDNNLTMFSKLHPHNHRQLPFSHHFHLPRDSEDDDSRTAAATPLSTTPVVLQKHNLEPNSSDGATIEVARRPRGRPPGSKNKPKPPVVITRDPEPAMSPYILEVPGGGDIVDAISRFCRRKSIGICVLTGSGTVANVTLRQPSTTPAATITFHGRFDILSISATFLPQTVSYAVPDNFTISLAGPQGQIVGGIVAGSLVAAGTVYVIAATFTNPSFYRLPADDEGRNSGSAGGGGGEGQSPTGSGAGGDSGGGGESCGMVMYSGHLPSDVIWAHTARPPQPPPPY